MKTRFCSYFITLHNDTQQVNAYNLSDIREKEGEGSFNGYDSKRMGSD